MFILTGLAMMLIAGIYAILQALATKANDMSQLRASKKMMEWAMTHEDEWLKNTDRIVRENGELHYYGSWKCDGYKKCISLGDVVHYGINNAGTEYGLINYHGDCVFGYRNFITAQTIDQRTQYDYDGERLISLGNFPVWGILACYKEVYKICGRNEYYIIESGYYKRVYYSRGEFTAIRSIS